MDFSNIRRKLAEISIVQDEGKVISSPRTSSHKVALKEHHSVNSQWTLFDLLPQMICICSDDGEVGYFNSIWRQYSGIELHEDSAGWLKFLHPDDREHAYSLWNQSLKTSTTLEKDCRIRNHSGEYRWFLLQANYQYNPALGGYYWYLSCTDVHERVLEQRALSDGLRAHTDMLDVSVDCIKIVRPNGTVSHMNKSGCIALLGKEREKNFGMKWLDLLPSEVRDKGQRAITNATKGKNARFAGMSISGEKTQYWDNILTPVLDDDGNTINILCVSRDITLQRVAEERLRIASEQDELTGLYNRRSFKKRLNHFISRAKEKSLSVGLLLIDLDHFKHINDTLGHPAGDHLLRALSKRLEACLPENAFAARLGGDEFAIVIGNAKNEAEIIDIAHIALKQIEAPITYKGKVINGGMSIGCSMYPRDARDGSGLMQCADTALNDLKEGGRGGYSLYNCSMMAVTEEKAAQLECARQIVRQNVIEPFYQPKVRLEDGLIVGFEALLRWRSADQQIQFPSTVVEAFNDYELATKISDIMQSKVFADLARWRAAGLRLVPVSLNAAPVEFLRDDYAERLLRRLEKHKIPATLIEVEITEHILSERGSVLVIRALNMLKQAGVRIALDDFGTGHSSLTHLRDYPVDSLKIDCDFVQRMNEEDSILAIVKVISQLGPSLDLDVVAEGIETEAQREVLRQAGCFIGQGFLFSRAIDFDTALEMLKRERAAP